MNTDRTKQMLELMKEDKRNVKNKSEEVCCCLAEKKAILGNRARLLLKYVVLAN